MTQEVTGLPTSIPIGPTDYSVEALVMDPEHPEKTFAEYDAEDQTVRVRDNLAYFEKLGAFWHEVTHIHTDRAGLDEVLGEKKTEAICELVGYMIATMIATDVLKWGPAVTIHSDKKDTNGKTKKD